MAEVVKVYIVEQDKKDTIAKLRQAVIKEPNGRPVLRSGKGYVSISHSGEYFAIAFSEGPVGLDIQSRKLRKGEDTSQACHRLSKLAQRFFHKDEAEFVLEGEGQELLCRFFMIWTAKESYVKYTGKGINNDFGKVSVLPQGNEPGERWQAQNAHFACTQGSDDYTLCLCTDEECEVEIICVQD